MKYFVVVCGIAVIAGIGWWMMSSAASSPTSTTDSFSTSTTQHRVDRPTFLDATSSQKIANLANKNHSMTATIHTSKGDIELEFFPNSAPKTVENFRKLAADDFYEGVIFHRVIEDFMIQGGDPTGTGTGGPGYTFEDELDPQSPAGQRGYTRGTLAMANSGPDTNGSQFFIMHKDQNLPFNYTIFGYVTDGMNVVDAIAEVDTNASDKPLEDVTIEDVEIHGE